MSNTKFSKTEIGLFCLALLVFLALIGLVFFQRDWLNETIWGPLPEEFDEESVEDEDVVSRVFEEVGDERSVDYALAPESKEVREDTFEIDVLVNEDVHDAAGFTLLMSFEGPAEYESFQEGDIEGCMVKEIKGEELQRDADLALYCLIPPTEDGEVSVSSGDIFATLKFNALESGEFFISFKDVLDSGEYLYDGNDGQYNLDY